MPSPAEAPTRIDLAGNTICPGFLVVVRGDPLADIDAVGEPENILLVVEDGTVAVDRGGFVSPAA